MLRDGETELVRYYCARRTKADLARPHVKPYVIYQRSVYDDMKHADPSATTYEIKALVSVLGTPIGSHAHHQPSR